jgi:hypothetical protein
MHQVYKVIFPFILFIFLFVGAQAQIGYSPYTSKGIGDLTSSGITHNRGMGGVGISNGSSIYYNNANPALLYRNSLSIFAIGMAGEYKEISTSEASQENVIGGLNYALIGLPLMVDKWTLGLGVMPYSTVNYKYSTEETVIGDSQARVEKDFIGSGGFNKFFVSNGFKINKNFSVGVTVGYLFGSIKDEVENRLFTQRLVEVNEIVNGDTITSIVPREQQNGGTLSTERLTIGNLYVTGGIAYRMLLTKTSALNLGLTYELGGENGARQYQNIRSSYVGENQDIANDTVNNTKGNIKLPSTFGIGLSYEKAYKWNVGIDLILRDWSNYANYQGDNEGFENNYKIAAGAEFIPDVSSVNSYLKRMTYRAGLSQQKLPYKINNETINEFGINFGVSLPVRNFSSFDLGFELGQRGTTDQNLIKEKYFQVYLGVTFNDKWFLRRRFD